MKKQFLAFTLILLGFAASAQEKKQRTLGLLISPSLDTKGLEDSYRDRRLSYTAGFFYDHQLSNRFGISTGFLLDTERFRMDYSRVRFFDATDYPKSAKLRVNAIEVPVNLTFCLNPDNENGYKALLYSGIMLHREFFSKWTGNYSDKVVIYKSDGNNNNLWSDSFMNLGFEFRKYIGNDYTGAIGIGAKFRPAHSLDFSSDFPYDPIILNLNLKFGRNL